MSLRLCSLSKWMLSVAAYAFFSASGRVLAVAVTPSTRPPFVTSLPSLMAVPAW